MKTRALKSLTHLFSLTLLLCFATACERGSNIGKPVEEGNLAGTWQYGSQPCHIAQNGNDILFINERGDQSRGRVRDESTVVATDWEGGLVGDVSQDKNTITWHNRTVWTRPK